MKISMTAARKNAGCSQSDMARELGVSVNTISAWETGKRIPNVKQFFRFCEICGMDITSIFLPS